MKFYNWIYRAVFSQTTYLFIILLWQENVYSQVQPTRLHSIKNSFE